MNSVRRINSATCMWFLGIAVSQCLVLSGCGGVNEAPGFTDEQKHMTRAGQLVMRASMMANNSVTPSSIQELKTFAKKLSPDVLKEIGVDDIDKAMMSPRDGQPLVIVGGISLRNVTAMGPQNDPKTNKPKGGMPASGPPPIMLYEQKGKDGMHYAVYSYGAGVVEVNEETLKERVPSYKP